MNNGMVILPFLHRVRPFGLFMREFNTSRDEELPELPARKQRAAVVPLARKETTAGDAFLTLAEVVCCRHLIKISASWISPLSRHRAEPVPNLGQLP
jgi:hypothetical protein